MSPLHASINTSPVYLVEDDDLVLRACQQAMKLAGILTRAFPNAEKALAALSDDPPALIVSDVKMPGISGLQLLELIHQQHRDIPVILITGHGDVSMAVEAMRAHAYDFIEKPFSATRLVDVVRRGLEKRSLLEENRVLKEALIHLRDRPLIGHSKSIQRILGHIESLASTDVDILILGETGTGKEVVAQALHAQSGREGPFVALNCGALPESVFESEIFGYEPGAFTGADKRRIGKMEFANQGTLFLDEIESMPLGLQVKLLRALQERCIERLGSNSSIPITCRILAATKTDLKPLVDAGTFRADLYYRLNVVALTIPPLRERIDDIASLMTYFTLRASERFNRPVPVWDEEDLYRWQQHEWPGNVRELKAVAERLCLGLGDGLAECRAPQVSLAARIENYERKLIQEALLHTQGHVAQAAQRLHVPKKTLYDKLIRHQLDPEDFRAE